MVKNTWVFSKMESLMVKEFTWQKIKRLFMRESSRITNIMVKASITGKMDHIMRGNILKD